MFVYVLLKRAQDPKQNTKTKSIICTEASWQFEYVWVIVSLSCWSLWEAEMNVSVWFSKRMLGHGFFHTFSSTALYLCKVELSCNTKAYSNTDSFQYHICVCSLGFGLCTCGILDLAADSKDKRSMMCVFWWLWGDLFSPLSIKHKAVNYSSMTGLIQEPNSQRSFWSGTNEWCYGAVYNSQHFAICI